MEKRTQNRWPVNGAATAFYLTGDQFGRIQDLDMLDFSDSGMGAISADPMDPGEVVSVGFEHSGYTARHGTVVTCGETERGYRLAIRFDRAMAA